MNYVFSNFHPTCSNKQVVQAPDGMHIVCLTCGVSANMEAISGKISAEDAVKVGPSQRTIIGKLSKGVNE